MQVWLAIPLSMTSRSREGNRDVVSSSVLVADAKEAESASETTLRTPKPPHLTGSNAGVLPTIVTEIYVQCGGQRFLRTAVNLGSSGLPVQGDILRRYISRGTVNTFRSKYKPSCDGISSNCFDSRCKFRRLLSSIASRLWPADSGARSKITFAGLVSGRFMSCDVKSDRALSESCLALLPFV